MKIRGRWTQAPYHLLRERKYLITLELDRLPKIYEETKDKDISIEIEEWSDKRSLRANNYFHELVGKIADKLYISKIEAKNILLSRYGQIDLDYGQVSLEEKIDWRALDFIHLQPTSEYIFEGDLAYRKYWIIRGSHTYNTKEMARLIDGTVSEAKELGIETMPPEELERMKAAWKGKA